MVARQDVVGNLREYRKHLIAELKRVDVALKAFDALDDPSTGSGALYAGKAPRRITAGGDGTFIMLRAVFHEDPLRELDAEAALRAILERGWKSNAANPVNAVRTALARMVTWGELERVDRGTYRLRVEEHADAAESPASPATNSMDEPSTLSA